MSETHDEIRTRHLVIEDADGRTAIELGVRKSGPVILLGAEGNTVIELAVSDAGPEIMVRSRTGKALATLIVDETDEVAGEPCFSCWWPGAGGSVH